ncbi:hypothetical protein N7481_011108 [Penicillium waksmanii]|uniref:uncharacterized protein n=1 Tax=Penicillium waksmanii TaxID=69791 RepID=UPI002548FC8B|nr:uncharacterized protein N7481_011108 [Penicillium waksmanii]KAJ5973898.1 hypothetical protein N7481_011108 [Penicillium waksmanii]
MAPGAMKRTASPTRAISPPPLRRKVESSVNKKTVNSFFAPTSQKKPGPITWRVLEKGLVIGKHSPESKSTTLPSKDRKVAAFDLDGTLIKTKSGNKFAKGPEDWKWWDTGVPRKVRELSSEGFQIVLFSNQSKISLKKEKGADSKSLSNFKEKLTAIMTQLDLPMSVYASTEATEYRKPRPGMWAEFRDDHDLDVVGVDMSNSVYVGDAAGRPGDFAATDHGFAANVGISFKTPEEFFLGQDPVEASGLFDPKEYIETQPETEFKRKHPLELVLFCGSPGSGKSTYHWNNLEPLGYERVNQDILKTRQKCLKVAREFLEAKKSVVVDNTNANQETREHWTTLAKELSVPVRVIHFLAPPELCKHNATVRAANKILNPESRASLPGIAFADYKRRYQEPTLDEGFEDIHPVPFRFVGDEEAKRIWGQYWV